MKDAPDAPEWVAKEVLPQVQGTIRSVHMIHPRSALVFTSDHAVVAEKGALSGVKVTRVDYPAGLFVNGAPCPHCGKPVLEAIGKVARLAPAEAPKAAPRAPKKRRK
jgi:hypothetical protein